MWKESLKDHWPLIIMFIILLCLGKKIDKWIDKAIEKFFNWSYKKEERKKGQLISILIDPTTEYKDCYKKTKKEDKILYWLNNRQISKEEFYKGISKIAERMNVPPILLV